MIQSVSKQFLEAAAKYSQAMAQGTKAGSSQDSTFKNYMQEVSNKRDRTARNDNLGKKDVQKPQEKQVSKNETKTEETNTDVTKKDDSLTTADDKVVIGDESGQEDETKISDAAQNLIDLSALVMQLSDNMVLDETASKITNVVINGVPQAEMETTAILTKPQGEPLTEAVLPVSQVAEQLVAQASKVQEKPQVATVNMQVPTEKLGETATPLVLKPEIVGDKAAQVVNNGETAKNAKTNAENAEAPKEVLSKAGEAKPIEVKVEVKTSQNETQTGKQAKTEETTTDATVLTAKPEKTEMPTITVKVGDGGQLNTQQMAKDVADAIIKKMPDKPNEFEIQITPKELGKITIKLLFENGQTLVSLSAGNTKTVGLLAECAKTIGAMIQQHTGNETVVTIQDDKNLTDQQKQEGNRQNAESKQQEEAKKQRQQLGTSQDFVQQMRLGLLDGEFAESKSRFY